MEVCLKLVFQVFSFYSDMSVNCKSYILFHVKTTTNKFWNDAEMLLKSFGTNHLQMMNGLEPLVKNWTGRWKGIPKGVDETHHLFIVWGNGLNNTEKWTIQFREMKT